MKYEEILEELKRIVPTMEIVERDDFGESYKVKSSYLGSFMSLDPCGKYHCMISPNNATDECMQFWEDLEKAANSLNGCIVSGEGDPTDIFFEIPVE